MTVLAGGEQFERFGDLAALPFVRYVRAPHVAQQAFDFAHVDRHAVA